MCITIGINISNGTYQLSLMRVLESDWVSAWRERDINRMKVIFAINEQVAFEVTIILKRLSNVHLTVNFTK